VFRTGMAGGVHHRRVDLPTAPRTTGQGMKTACVIVNGSAGNGHDDDAARRLEALFGQHGWSARVDLADSGAAMIASARAALQGRTADVVVAGGGDGTINAVASVLAGADMPLGVLPLGTLNHFAKDLGIPLALEAAVATVATGRVVAVDVGEVNGVVFLNNSSLGLYPDIVRDRERQQRRLGRGKWPAALWATMAALRRYPFLDVRLRIDGRDHHRRTPFVFIGNNEYTMEGLSIGERGSLTDGKLSLYVAQRPGRLALLRFAILGLLGGLKQARDFDAVLVESLTVETGHARLRVATDGEVTVMETPLQYRVRRGALPVIVPA
jgi:diacylglycerol kinase family enzyme